MRDARIDIPNHLIHLLKQRKIQIDDLTEEFHVSRSQGGIFVMEKDLRPLLQSATQSVKTKATVRPKQHVLNKTIK